MASVGSDPKFFREIKDLVLWKNIDRQRANRNTVYYSLLSNLGCI
jgi:hypothetical protein